MLRIRAGARAAGRLVLLALVAAVMLPSLAAAQSITGVVRDPSGAVLPGVTIEAASPALIEKVRTAVSDGTGQYRVTDLPPGTYVLTFSLQGFTTVKREGVAVSGSGVIAVNVDMRVGKGTKPATVELNAGRLSLAPQPTWRFEDNIVRQNFRKPVDIVSVERFRPPLECLARRHRHRRYPFRDNQ